MKRARSHRVERLQAADRDAVVAVLAATFWDYPVMRYVLGREDPDYERRLHALIGFYTDRRLLCGWPVLSIHDDGDLIAAALVSEPTRAPVPATVEAALARMRTAIGEAAYQRMQAFERASDDNEPEGPHHFVGMLGTLPRHQGNGCGKALLQRTRELAIEGGSVGVSLSTEDPSNVPFYEHLGFEVVAEADVGELHTWCLQWPNG